MSLSMVADLRAKFALEFGVWAFSLVAAVGLGQSPKNLVSRYADEAIRRTKPLRDSIRQQDFVPTRLRLHTRLDYQASNQTTRLVTR